MRHYLIAGNWKMNKTAAEARTFFHEIKPLLPQSLKNDVLICAPFTALDAAKQALPKGVHLGAENVYPKASGAYTGEISVDMLSEFVDYVIVGHSERRTLMHETDAFINEKIKALLAGHLKPILCVGESLEERKAQKAFDVIERELCGCLSQISAEDLNSVVIAYEPIWAIGTGETATPEIAQEVHAFIRAWLVKHYSEAIAKKIPLLYGGSLKASNARELLSQKDIDGGLIGGASLDPKNFVDIINIAEELI